MPSSGQFYCLHFQQIVCDIFSLSLSLFLHLAIVVYKEHLLIQFQLPALFVVSALIITSTFPDDTQALAGAVFNTFSQFGTAIGLAVVAVISSSVSQTYSTSHAHSPAGVAENAYTPRDLLEGYRASFWFLFGGAILTSVIGAFGLRNVSNKGLKTE